MERERRAVLEEEESGLTRPTPTWRRRLLCWLGRHEYLWNGYIIHARAIRSWSRLDTRLTCAHCPASIGPQTGENFEELVKRHGR